MKARFVFEKFKQDTDPIKDMGIGIKGLWDYTIEEAAKEIWAIMKPNVQKSIDSSRRTGRTYFLNPLSIVEIGNEELGFDPSKQTSRYLAKLVQKEIDKSIKDHTINLHSNVKYVSIKESLSEKFEQDTDPVKDLGIGIPGAGTILISKQEVPTKKIKDYDRIIAKGYYSVMTRNSFWFVIDTIVKKKYFIMTIKAMDNLEHAKLFAKTSTNGPFTNWHKFNLKLTYDEFNQYFKIVS